MKHVGVYSIVNTVSGKTYIGQSADVYQRWRQHRHRLGQGSHQSRHLQAAWKLYGPESFVFTLLLECSPEDLGKEEIAALAKVPETMRYNVGVAGDNPTLGLARSRESRIRQSRSLGGRPFFQKNIATGEIRRFEYAAEASVEHADVINLCLAGKRLSERGFEYCFDPTFVPVPFIRPYRAVEKRNREIVGTNLTTGAERRFPYVAKVEEDKAFQRTGVIKCLSGEMQTHRGYAWRYADGLPHKTMADAERAKLSVGARKRGGSRAVVGTDPITGKTVHFPYVGAATKELNIRQSYIHLVLGGRMKEAGGFTWAYADGLPHRARNQ